MPPKRYRPQRPTRRSPQGTSPSGQILERRAVAQPDSATILRVAEGEPGGQERWELICRDGWEWQRATAQGPRPGATSGPGAAGGRSGGAGNGAPLVWVRAATLSADQAMVVGQWMTRIRDPQAWWEVSRALQTPESAPAVAAALSANPWLREVLPAILEASTDGAPPPPPAGR